MNMKSQFIFLIERKINDVKLKYANFEDFNLKKKNRKSKDEEIFYEL